MLRLRVVRFPHDDTSLGQVRRFRRATDERDHGTRIHAALDQLVHNQAAQIASLHWSASCPSIVVVLTGHGIFRGIEGVRAKARLLEEQLPGGRWNYRTGRGGRGFLVIPPDHAK